MEDLWEVVCGRNWVSPADTPRVWMDALKYWRMVNAKVEFILRRSLSLDLLEHIVKCK